MTDLDEESVDQPRTVSELIEDHTKIHGREVILEKFFSYVDGLCKSHRRILWSALALKGSYNGVFKSQILMGDTVKIHPHGDQAIYKTITYLSSPFNFNHPLFDFQSKIGSYSGDTAGASRYTELRIDDFARDVYFGDVEIDVLPVRLTYNRDGFEPVELVPVIPMTLIMGTFAVGFGFSENTVPMNLRNVCDLAIAYTKHAEHDLLRPFDPAPHAEKFLPDFPILNYVTNSQELIQEYKQGNFKASIKIDGYVELGKDKIAIWTLPHRASFKSIREKFTDSERQDEIKKLWTALGITGVSVLPEAKQFRGRTIHKLEIGNAVFTFKRGTDIFETWEKLNSTIGFSRTISQEMNYTTPDGYITKAGPIEILRAWYTARRNIVLASKKHALAKLLLQRHLHEARIVIKNHTDEIVAIMRGEDVKSAQRELREKFQLTITQTTFLMDANLKILLKSSLEELVRIKEKMDQDIKAIQHGFDHIGDEIIAQIQKIKKKYGKERSTVVPKYIGCVQIGSGCIQIEDLDEIEQILENFGNIKGKIHLYEGSHLVRVDNRNQMVDNIPRVGRGRIYGFRHDPKSIFTIQIKDNNGVCVKGFIPDKDDEGFIYTTRKSMVIYRDGTIKSVDVTKEFSYRKTICGGSQTKAVYVYPDVGEVSYLTVFSEKVPNVMMMYRITSATPKVPLNPSGKLKIYHSSSPGNWYMNIDPEFLSRQSFSLLRIIDVEPLLDGAQSVRLDLGSQKVRRHPCIEVR